MNSAIRCLAWVRQAFSWQDWLLFSSVFLATSALSARTLLSWAAILAWILSLSFFLVLKLLDELLDFSMDQSAGRTSFLLCGKVRRQELWLLVLLLLLAQFCFAMSFQRNQTLIVWSVLTICAFLLAYPCLAHRPVLYSSLHYLLLPGFVAWQFSQDHAWTDFGPAHALLMLILYTGALQYELCRKLDLRYGYAAVLTLYQSCLGIALMNLLACLSGVILLTLYGQRLFAQGIIVCVFFFTSYALVRLLFKPTPARKMLLQQSSGFSLLSLNLVIFSAFA